MLVDVGVVNVEECVFPVAEWSGAIFVVDAITISLVKGQGTITIIVQIVSLGSGTQVIFVGSCV